MSLYLQQKVNILIDMGGDETTGFISDIDPNALPGENSPYRVVNEIGTRCLGWFEETELNTAENETPVTRRNDVSTTFAE